MSQKGAANSLMHESPLTPGPGETAKSRGLQKYLSVLPSGSKSKLADVLAFRTKGSITAVKQSLFASLQPGQEPERKRPQTRNSVGPDSFTAAAGLRGPSSFVPKAVASPRNLFLESNKPKASNSPSRMQEAKDKFIKSRQSLARFAPLALEDPTRSRVSEPSAEASPSNRLSCGGKAALPPTVSASGKTPLLRQRSRIKLLMEQIKGKDPAAGKGKPTLGKIGRFMTAKNLFENLRLPVDPKPSDPLNKAMQRFLLCSCASPRNKVNAEKGPFALAAPAEKREPFKLSIPTSKAPQPRLEIIIPEAKEEEEDEPTHKRVAKRRTGNSDSGESCSLAKHRAMRAARKLEKLHGIQPQIERLRQIMAENTTLLV